MKTKVQVRDLRIGDVLSSGAKIVSPPISGAHLPNKLCSIGVQYGSEVPTSRNWGKYTTVTVINR